MVQEQCVPASSIFSTHYVTNDTDGHSIELRSAPLNSSLLDSALSNINWYKNGTRISVGGNEEGLSLISIQQHCHRYRGLCQNIAV